MKQTALQLMQAAGVFASFRLANRGKALIVMYHRVGEGINGAVLSPSAFEEQIAYLKSRYSIVSLSAIADCIIKDQELPAGLAAITVDDGYRDAYDHIFPILKKFEVPATIFVVTKFIDGQTWLWTDKLRYLTSRIDAQSLDAALQELSLNVTLNRQQSQFEKVNCINTALKAMPDAEKEAALQKLAALTGVAVPVTPPAEFSALSWEQVREMDGNGVEIGSHTVSHPILTQISPERLHSELTDSRIRLEAELGRSVDLFCYPNGNRNPQVEAAVRRAGYKCAVTATPGFTYARSNPFALERISTEPDMAHFIQSTSGFEKFKKKFLRAGNSAASAAALAMEHWEL